MKALIRKALAMFGLATAGQVAQATAQAHQAAEKIRQLETRMAKLREDADGWRQRHQQAADAAAEWKKAAARAEADLAKAGDEAARVGAQLAEWRARAEALAGQLREHRDRLDESRRVSTRAREHLMATEVKLDLVEAAIRILDERTRDTAPRT
jgi:chromosome segregation ATPase